MSAHHAALREFHGYGNDSTIHCWAGGEPFECRRDSASDDERICLRSSIEQHGFTLSERVAMSQIEQCMHMRGWIRLDDSLLLF